MDRTQPQSTAGGQAVTKARAEELVREALTAGFSRLAALGEQAKKISGKQVDITTAGDLAAGQAITEYFQRQKEGFVIYTEEQGLSRTKEVAAHTVVVDDIDGTLNFKAGMGMLPHGSVVGIFEGTEPRFSDCIAAGFLEFNSGNLFMAVRGGGAYMISGFTKGGKTKARIETSKRPGAEGNAPVKLGLDLYIIGGLAPAFADIMEETWAADFRSKAFHLSQVASGALDLFISPGRRIARKAGDQGRKKKAGPEEIGPLYLLIREAGGAVTDWEGEDIGERKLGLKDGSSPDIIVAATRGLAMEFAERLASIPDVQKYLKS